MFAYFLSEKKNILKATRDTGISRLVRSEHVAGIDRDARVMRVW